ncbi:MAG TPA: YCF48-related protein [Pyrinomonadaceae bacterium]|nr:YCF48-related protein [Pyrinomonadaceae bacterium]
MIRHGDTERGRHGETRGRSQRLPVPPFPRLLVALLLLLTAHCSLPTASAATWSRQKSGTMAWLHAVQFLDQNHGWVAGSGGTLLETGDGGATWKRVATLTKDTLRDVCFVDEHTGWLIAERDVYKLKTNDEARSYLLRTDDGGLTWRPIYLDGTDLNARLVRVIFADAAHGWVFGETGVVLATSDGGAHWTPQSPPTRHLLLGGAFFDSSRLWLVGASSTIIHTSNSGVTWQTATVRDNVKFRFHSTSFISDRLGWAVGSSGRIFATSDGGRTWFSQRSNVAVDLLDVKFISPSEGWAAGANGTLLRTVNGGRHWFAETTGISHELTRIHFVDRNHGWAVGFGGTILKLGQSTAPSLR